MRRACVLGLLIVCSCGGGGGAALDAGNPGNPANLGGDLAFKVGDASVGTTSADNLTLLLQERGPDGCLPAGARSLALTLRTLDGSALTAGSYALGVDAGLDAGSPADGGDASDGGLQPASDAGGVRVIALYSDGDAGLIDLRATSGSVSPTTIDASTSDNGAGNRGNFDLQFVFPDGQPHRLTGVYDLSFTCQDTSP